MQKRLRSFRPSLAVWETTKFDAKQKILDVLVQRRIGMEQTFANEGTRGDESPVGVVFPRWRVASEARGRRFHLFLKDLIDNYDERFDALAAKLEEVRATVFGGPALASFTGSAEECDAFWAAAGDMGLARDERRCGGRDVRCWLRL